MQIIWTDGDEMPWAETLAIAFLHWPLYQSPPYSMQQPVGEYIVTASMQGGTVTHEGRKHLAIFGTISDGTGTIAHLNFKGIMIGYSVVKRLSDDPRAPERIFGAN
jgi:hypothetical protein